MKKILFPAIFACLISGPAVGQQVDEEIVQEGAVQSRMIIASDDGTGDMPQVMFMSSEGGGNSYAFSGPDDVFRNAPDIFSLAQNGGVQKEIELVDEQMEQLKKINADFSKRIQEQMKSLQDDKGNFDISRAKNLSQLIQDLNAEKQAKMQDVFLPHQFERLRQISLQTQMRRGGDSSMLANKEVVEALGLTDEQQKKLKDKAAELKVEMEEDIKQLKEKARKKLFAELTSDQREKLESMLGSDFEVKQQNMRNRVRRARSRDRSDEKDFNADKTEDKTEDK